MGSTKFWLLLLGAQILILAALAMSGPTAAGSTVLRLVGYVCIVGVFASIPPLMIKLFVAGQTRIGNADLSMVRAVRENQMLIVVGVYVLIGAALVMAWPQIRKDIAADRNATLRAQEASAEMDSLRQTVTADTHQAAATADSAAPEMADGGKVETPGAGSATRTAILDIIRFRLKSESKFKVDHIRTYRNWAFVRATEVVELDQGELQETDLTVTALLQLPEESANGSWRIVEMWTLPGDQQHPFAEFMRGVRSRQQQAGLPAALFPQDL